MSHDHIVPDKSDQCLHRLILVKSRSHFLVRNSGQFHHPLRYTPSRIHQCRITRRLLMTAHAHRTNLDHLIQFRIESRHLQIDHRVIAPQYMFRFFVLSLHVQPPSSFFSPYLTTSCTCTQTKRCKAFTRSSKLYTLFLFSIRI